MPTLEDFRNNSGEFAPEQPEANVQDAAAQPDDLSTAEVIEESATEPAEEQQEDAATAPTTPVEASEDDDLPPLSEKEKTAFEKRLERERRKLEEEKEKLRKEYEEQANPYKEVVELLGGDPAKIKETVKQNQLIAQANQYAEQYGWDDMQTQQYIAQEQQKLRDQQTQRELQELRIVNEINKLSRQPEYQGIDHMEKDIVSKVIQSNGALSAKEAFFALGGESRLKQMQRETEQRMVLQRAQQRRVVQTDSAPTPSTEKPIPQDILQEGLRRGMSERQIRELMEFDASNIHEYRAQKKKAK